MKSREFTVMSIAVCHERDCLSATGSRPRAHRSTDDRSHTEQGPCKQRRPSCVHALLRRVGVRPADVACCRPSAHDLHTPIISGRVRRDASRSRSLALTFRRVGSRGGEVVGGTVCCCGWIAGRRRSRHGERSLIQSSADRNPFIERVA